MQEENSILLTRPTKEGDVERTEYMMAAEENAKYCWSVQNICSEGLSLVTRRERAHQGLGHKCFTLLVRVTTIYALDY